MNKVSADIEQEKAYALLGILTKLADSLGTVPISETESVRVADHIYVVGGAVRNFIIGQPVKDIDMVIDALALSSRRIKRDAKWFADLIIKNAPSSAQISQASNDYGVEILHIHGDWEVSGLNVRGQEIEIAFARKESYASGGYKPEQVEKATIEEDARRREFTFNTLLWSLSDLNDHGPSEEIVQDPLGVGLRDLKDNVMDTPLSPEQTFEDDASRMMRTMKFQFKYGFEPSQRVKDAIRNNPEFLRNVPAELLYVLLTTTILNQDTYKQALEEMYQNNMLSELIRIMKSNEAFRSSIARWVRDNKDLDYLFNLLDYELPLDDQVRFLSDEDKAQARINISNMSPEVQEKYLQSLKNVGFAIKDKSFFMKAFEFARNEVGLGKRDIPLFRADYYEIAARSLLLEDPSLIDDPEKLKSMILEKISIENQSKDISKESVLNNIKDITRKSGAMKKEGQVTNPFDIFIPQLNGEVYIFDMDDTLFWSPEWHTIVETNDNDDAVSVDMNFPNTFHKAVSFIEEVNQDYINVIKKNKKGELQKDLIDSYEQEIGKLRLIQRVVDIPILGKEDQVVFVLSREDGSAVDVITLKKYFSSKRLKAFDTRGKYVEGVAVIAGDATFYKSPRTLGHIPNEEILNIYKEHNDNAVVLTARETTEGMQSGIIERIESVGAEPPLIVFTKPMGLSGGEYKAHVIGQIAQQDSVTSIRFYDDNLRYVNAVTDILQVTYGPDVFSKVNIYRVNVAGKPEESTFAKLSCERSVKMFDALIKAANKLDIMGLNIEANRLDSIISKINYISIYNGRKND